jgi:myo-inositol-1-phosphate synthase
MSKAGNSGGDARAADTQIQPAQGRLGIMIPGMGAVATTFIAGVEAVRKGIAKPIGSLTQMGTIRLGKRTDGRTPLVREFVPLARLEDLCFAGWDIFAEDMFQAASTARVLEREQLEKIRPFLEGIRPLPAVFDQHYVKRLHGANVKKGKNKRDLAEQLRADVQTFKKTTARQV